MSKLPSNAQYAPIGCNWCHGSGKDRVLKIGDCHTCDGQGTVLVIQPPQPCAGCGRTGTSKDPAHDPNTACFKCDGSGWAYTWTGK